MTPPPASGEPDRHHPGCEHLDCPDPGCTALRRDVDATLGAGFDRAFDVLDDIRACDRNSCSCTRCATRIMMLHLILSRELRALDQQHGHRDP